jgi:tripartite ATP-independent transporter DctM subunit
MDDTHIFLVLIVTFFVLLGVGAPIFSALGMASIVGFILYGGFQSLETIPEILYRGMTSYSLLAVPLFVLMGEIVARTSIGGRLFRLFFLWLNRLPGNLAAASVASSAIFGAMSGVSVAGAATIGRFAIPEMLKFGYAGSLAGGTVAAAGALALLIPPSIGLVLYGELADQSVGRLFIAAIIPAAILTVLMLVYVVVLALVRPDMAPRMTERIQWADRLKALKSIWPALVIGGAVLGSIYFGIATPTEAAAIGATGAALVAALYGELNRQMLIEALRSTAITTTMIMLILASALLFGYIITRLMIPQSVVMFISELDQPAWVIMLFVLIFLVLVGMFLDLVSLIVITIPVLLPIVIALQLDPIWFGIVMIIACEMAVITPPIGLNLYVIKGIAPDLSLRQIINGALPFVLIEVLVLVIITIFPELVLWLPSLM